MDEAARLGGELLGDATEDLLDRVALARRELFALRLETVFAKMIELPLEEVIVEAAREGDALRIGMGGGEALERDELIDRGAIVARAHVVAGIGDARLEGDVAEVLEVEEAALGVEAEDRRDRGAGPREVALYINEGELCGCGAFGRLLGLERVVAELHHHYARPLAAVEVDAVIASHGGAAGEGLEARIATAAELDSDGKDGAGEIFGAKMRHRSE